MWRGGHRAYDAAQRGDTLPDALLEIDGPVDDVLALLGQEQFPIGGDLILIKGRGWRLQEATTAGTLTHGPTLRVTLVRDATEDL